MDFETVCKAKGGIFRAGTGCFLSNDNLLTDNEFPTGWLRTELAVPADVNGRDFRLYYETSKERCEKNGDEHVQFGDAELFACKELQVSEYCQKNMKPTHTVDGEPVTQIMKIDYTRKMEACTEELIFPDKKLEKAIDSFQEEHLLREVYRNQHLSPARINQAIERGHYLDTLFDVKNQTLLSENIDKAIERGNALDELYTNHKLNQKQIAKAIGKGSSLSPLFTHQWLTVDNIDRAIKTTIKEHERSIKDLFRWQELTEKQIDAAIASPDIRGDVLETLYFYQELTSSQIDKALESDKGELRGLYQNQKIRFLFTPKQIEKALDEKSYVSTRQSDLKILYQKYKLNQKQVNKAITMGVSLEALVQHQSLSNAQVVRIIKTCEGEELFQLYSKKGTMTKEQIDLALKTNLNYIAMLYQYQKMTPEQIDNALGIGINRESIYANQRMMNDQITRAIEHELKEKENDLQKQYLFEHQKLSDAHINRLIEYSKQATGDTTINILLSQQVERLNKQQILRVIDVAESYHDESHQDELIDLVFDTQKVDEEVIDKIIKTDVSMQLVYAKYGNQLTPHNVDTAMKKGVDLGELFVSVHMTSKQIDEAIEKGESLSKLFESQINILSEEQIEEAIIRGEDLKTLYTLYHLPGEGKTLTSEHIDLAIEKGLSLGFLYENQFLDSTQINRAIQQGEHLRELYCDSKSVFNDNNIRIAINHGADLENLYACKGRDFSSEIIDLAIERGEALHELYEHSELNEDQITRAILMGGEIPQLFNYQKIRLTKNHLDIIIEQGNEDLLYYMYSDDTLTLTDEQRERLTKKISDRIGILTPPSSSLVLSTLNPKFWKEFEERKKVSIEARIKENPLQPLVGVYPLSADDIWKDIKDIIEEKGYVLSDDGKYAIDKNDQKKRMRVGKILTRQFKTEHHPMMRKYKTLMSQKISPMHVKAQEMSEEEVKNLEIVISDSPDDIAAKSTGHKILGTSCETVDPTSRSHAFGWGRWTKEQIEGKEPAPSHGCGWCSDVEANNLIVYLRKKDEPDPKKRWLGRAMIRWCIREDDGKPDAILENYYKQSVPESARYHHMFNQAVTDIMNKHGFTGSRDGHKCTTPYPYTGYDDFATESYPSHNGEAQTIKTYHIGSRPG